MDKAKSRFEGLLGHYFDGLMKADPVFAVVTAGVSSGEGKLGSLGSEFHASREKQRQLTLARLDEISPRDLSNEQQIDRLALRSKLLRESEDYERGRHQLEPNAPDHVLGVLFHELRRGHDKPARAAKNLRSLLRQTPEFLAEAAQALHRPEPVWLEVMEQTVTGAEDLLRGVASFLATVAPASTDFALVSGASKGLQRYRDHARDLRPASAGSFAIGSARLQRRIRDELGLDYTLGQVEALALAEAQRMTELLRQACARFGRNRAPEQVIQEARQQWRPTKPLLELYQSETARVAAGFKQARAVTFPRHDTLQVRPVPDFLRAVIPTAAYTQPGAFSREQLGVFWVNDLSADKKTESEKLLEKQQHFGIALTCAHEAYPGHHLQFVTSNTHPRKWRRLFAHAIFYEGWTLWCEQMMADLRIDRSPWLLVQQRHDALWRCHRILVDLRLQTGKYNSDQAVRHLQKNLGFTKARAQADVNWYTAQPGVPMSYWLGLLENERLRLRLVVGRGWTLRQFNDWLLSFGTVPQAWIEKYGLD
jgi:uncharacterized protein (DUF885 family)